MVILMLTHQPLFLGGIDDVDRAKSNAYGALFSFLVAFGVSVFYLIQNGVRGGGTSDSDRRSRRRGDAAHHYEGIPSNNSNVLNEYALNLDLPRSVQEGVFS